jgi:DtxR family transcriptional regulator, manganese transport regulator
MKPTEKKSLERAEHFKTTRKHHSNETAEDYTELISDLIKEKGSARIGDISKNLGISHVTALRTVRRLEKEGYLIAPLHQEISLTSKGKKIALFSKKRHTLLIKFFCEIGIPRRLAEIDIEGIEHHISQETLTYIQKFLTWISYKDRNEKLRNHMSDR